MNNPYFSVVIPTLNEERYVPLILKDLSQQTFSKFELIVADASSTDATLKEIKKFDKKFPLTILANEKKNVSIQRNNGAKKARGAYFIFFDADSRITSQFLSQIYQETKISPFDFASPIVKVQSKKIFDICFAKWSEIVMKIMIKTKQPVMGGSCMIFNRSTFFSLKGFDPTLYHAEDVDLACRAAQQGKKGRMLNNIYYFFSLRRLNTESRASLFLRYAISFFYNFLVGPIRKPIFSYKMGGHVHEK